LINHLFFANFVPSFTKIKSDENESSLPGSIAYIFDLEKLQRGDRVGLWLCFSAVLGLADKKKIWSGFYPGTGATVSAPSLRTGLEVADDQRRLFGDSLARPDHNYASKWLGRWAPPLRPMPVESDFEELELNEV
jgi:hypothetical protein